jgi:hypothetical protein
MNVSSQLSLFVAGKPCNIDTIAFAWRIGSFIFHVFESLGDPSVRTAGMMKAPPVSRGASRDPEFALEGGVRTPRSLALKLALGFHPALALAGVGGRLARALTFAGIDTLTGKRGVTERGAARGSGR